MKNNKKRVKIVYPVPPFISPFDPLGSYTGTPFSVEFEIPEQDVDDL